MDMEKSMEGPTKDGVWGSRDYAETTVTLTHALEEKRGVPEKVTGPLPRAQQRSASIRSFPSMGRLPDRQLQRVPGGMCGRRFPKPGDPVWPVLCLLHALQQSCAGNSGGKKGQKAYTGV